MEYIIDREVAWRIFALEFNRSTLYISEGDERAPNYIITPTGVKCNRLFIVGVVTETEIIGADNNLWKARIADPTGVFTVYAGQYQPEAAIFLSELKVPAYVAVVGKARKYEPEEGSVYTSIRPEEINNADEVLRDRWVLDTAELTFERIRIIEEALESGLSGNDLKEYLLKRGANAMLADGAARAVQHYKNLDKIIAELKNALIHAVELILSDRIKTEVSELHVEKEREKEPQIDADEPEFQKLLIEKQKEPQIDTDEPGYQELFTEKQKEPQMNADERRFQELFTEKPEQGTAELLDKVVTEPERVTDKVVTEPERVTDKVVTEPERVLDKIITEPESAPKPGTIETPVQIEPKEVLADIIDRLDTGKGISYTSVVEAAISAGFDASSAEAGIKELMAEGRCYEPKIGVLRKV